MNNLDPECVDFTAIQIAQNNFLRSLNGSKIKAKVSIESLFKKFNASSVNQLNAQIKLQEIWKALNVDNYPLKISQQRANMSGVSTRAGQSGRPIEIGKKHLTQKTSISDAIRVWNLAPQKVNESKSLYQAKKEIKNFVKTLPI